ncbi:glycosyl transferase family group 2-domain-containing protein [Fusarium venenatum]|uniref:glycosyl transferase family group 2-domain-containing protein n=1 Tax=Fusarium venenatum TaxID=56646 RepID=UPI001DE5F722|nr:glycosyl transferase family group 2-domain-containing protein [Fusarium venenatum]
MSTPVSHQAREQSFSKMLDGTTLSALQPKSGTNSVSSTPNRCSTIPSTISTPFKPRMSRRATSDFQGNGSRSRPASIAPSRHSFIGDLDINDPAMLAKYASRRATLLGWFEEPAERAVLSGVSLTGLAIKATEGHVFQPSDVDPLLQFAVSKLDAEALISISSETLVNIIGDIPPAQRSLVSESTGARIPVVPNLEAVTPDLCHYSRACIALEERIVLVWSQDPKAIIHVADHVQQEIYDMTQTPSEEDFDQPGRARSTVTQLSSDTAPVATPAVVRGGLDEKNKIFSRSIALEENEDENDDVEMAAPVRPRLKMHAFKVSFAIMLVIVTQSLGVTKLLNEYYWDGGLARFGLLATIPPLTLFSLFFFIVLVTSVFQLLLPVSACLKNSRFHSAIKPNPKRHRDYGLPHITIQMPVYKEGLKGVIVPIMISVMAAIEYYEQQGGSASVFINDDGMQIIQHDLAEARKVYYRENGIGYTARLPNCKVAKKGGFLSWFKKSDKNAGNNAEKDESEMSPQELSNKIGFLRKGKFKKASNMNYGLSFSNRVEDELIRLTQTECPRRECSEDNLTVDDDNLIYQQALANMLAEDNGRTWAEGNVRIGELILIIDCDTRVPPRGSGVMQVVHNTFENGITYFTNVVYTAIKYGVGSGDVSPFVGHNAFLRWKAMQDIAFVDPSDGQEKWWSDAHVSEDFDISLRVQMAGSIVRLATYHNGGFKEGVSLTLYDELTRWEKYAYGCNELVFHPFYQWPYKGPVTRLFLRFLWSNMPITSKITITAYIFTCIWLSLVVVFNGLGSVAFSMARHQLKEEVFWRAFLQSMKWLPFLVIYFGGISLNCAKALLCHAFSINIEWSSTAKEPGPSGFFIGLDKMIESFKYTWIICIVLSVMMIYFAVGAPWGYTITPGPHSTAVVAIVPLAIQVCSAFFLPLTLGLN